MKNGISRLRLPIACVAVAVLILVVTVQTQAQAGEGGPVPLSQTAKQAAPIDLTGYWTSVITEDWRWRMITPPKGDYWSIPLSAEGRKLADSWDPDRDRATGNECRAYGAAGLMRLPTRLHITWENENTLRIDTDTGRQTRLLHFAESVPPNTQPSWQGYSIASWESGVETRDIGNLNVTGRRSVPGGNLRIITTHMRPGYLRKNGVPYSDSTILTEYLDRFQDYGVDWLILTAVVNDPKYLSQSFITSTHFKRETDGSKWNPTPCESTYGPVR
jgi:hypothetical protein